MKIFLFLLLINSINGMDNSHIKLLPKHNYYYDYSVHYCENNDGITHYYESQYGHDKKKGKVKRTLKRIRIIFTTIIMCAVSGIASIAQKLS